MIRPVKLLPQHASSAPEEGTGFGMLETSRGRLPLRAMSVQAVIRGLVAHVHVQQRFVNSLQQALEATYVFPLPDQGAVTRFVMQVGARRLEAQLQERAQARQQYRQAVQRGHQAALAEEDRPEVFSVQVGNIPPGSETTVELELVMPLEVADGEATFRFPLVVAPRYVSGSPLEGRSVGGGTSPDTDQVPDASRVTPPVLLPGFPNPVELSLQVELHPDALYAPDWQQQLACTLHSTLVEEGPPCRVRLEPGERLDRDFLLRFPLATGELCSTWLVAPAEDDGQAGVFALTIVPPADVQERDQRARDVVFVLDRSGSMHGWKIVAARRALGRMIDSLREQDRFALLAFDHHLSVFRPTRTGRRTSNDAPAWNEATNRNRYRALEWLSRVEAQGGTEMRPALQAAVKLLGQEDGQSRDREPILVLVTDGQVAGEDAALRALQKQSRSRPVRVFAVGIDRAANLGLLRRLAQRSNGWCELIESEDRLDQAMQRIHRNLAQAVLDKVELEPEGWDGQLEALCPEPLPDVFAGRPVTICGRFRGGRSDSPVTLRVRGRLSDGSVWEQQLQAVLAPAQVLLPLWGRMHVRQLEDQYVLATDAARREQLAQQIVHASLESRVLSRFTAYVVVDHSEVVNPEGKVVSITQPVELPSGWEASFGSVEKHCGFPMLTGMLASIFVPHRLAKSFWNPNQDESDDEAAFSPMASEEEETASAASEVASDQSTRQLDQLLQNLPPEARPLATELRWLLNRIAKTDKAPMRRRLWDRVLKLLRKLASVYSPHAPEQVRQQLRQVLDRVEEHVDRWHPETPWQQCAEVAETVRDLFEQISRCEPPFWR